MNIHDMYDFFQEALREVEAGEMGLIPDGVNVGEDMSLKMSLRRGSTTEVVNKYLYFSVVEENNHWRKR